MVYTVTAGRVLPAVALAVLVFESAMTLDGKGLRARHAARLRFKPANKSVGAQHAVPANVH